MNIAPARENERLGKSAMDSESLESFEFAERRGAEVERGFDVGDEFVFGVGFGEFGSFGAATPETLEQKRRLDSAICSVR